MAHSQQADVRSYAAGTCMRPDMVGVGSKAVERLDPDLGRQMWTGYSDRARCMPHSVIRTRTSTSVRGELHIM